MCELIWCKNFNEDLAAECWRGKWSEVCVCIDGWTDGWGEEQETGWMTASYTEMNDGPMMDGDICCATYLWCKCTDRLCCSIASLHLAYVLCRQLFICIWHKLCEQQLTPHYYKLNPLTAERSCLAVINNVRLCCLRHRCNRCWETGVCVYLFV